MRDWLHHAHERADCQGRTGSGAFFSRGPTRTDGGGRDETGDAERGRRKTAVHDACSSGGDRAAQGARGSSLATPDGPRSAGQKPPDPRSARPARDAPAAADGPVRRCRNCAPSGGTRSWCPGAEALRPRSPAGDVGGSRRDASRARPRRRPVDVPVGRRRRPGPDRGRFRTRVGAPPDRPDRSQRPSRRPIAGSNRTRVRHAAGPESRGGERPSAVRRAAAAPGLRARRVRECTAGSPPGVKAIDTAEVDPGGVRVDRPRRPAMATATRVVDQTPTGDEPGETYATRPDRAGRSQRPSRRRPPDRPHHRSAMASVARARRDQDQMGPPGAASEPPAAPAYRAARTRRRGPVRPRTSGEARRGRRRSTQGLLRHRRLQNVPAKAVPTGSADRRLPARFGIGGRSRRGGVTAPGSRAPGRRPSGCRPAGRGRRPGGSSATRPCTGADAKPASTGASSAHGSRTPLRGAHPRGLRCVRRLGHPPTDPETPLEGAHPRGLRCVRRLGHPPTDPETPLGGAREVGRHRRSVGSLRARRAHNRADPPSSAARPPGASPPAPKR